MIVRWNELPDPQEFCVSIVVRDIVKESKYKHESLPENVLIKDLWAIVFDFLDYNQPMDISLPLSTLQETLVDGSNGNCNYCSEYVKYEKFF